MKRKLIIFLLLLGTVAVSAQTFSYTGIDLKSERVKKKNVYEWENILLANYGYTFNGGVHGVGLTYARCKLGGFYVNAMVGTDWNFAYNTRTTDDYFVTNETSHPRISIGGGAMIRMVVPFYAYLGAGYTYKELNYKCYDGYWARYTGWLNLGHCAHVDVGLMGSIKGFTIQAGYTLIINGDGDVANELKVGLGYSFPDKKKGGAE